MRRIKMMENPKNFKNDLNFKYLLFSSKLANHALNVLLQKKYIQESEFLQIIQKREAAETAAMARAEVRRVEAPSLLT